MSKITIKDVAKKAGVSISTASYAINNTGPVSAKTKEKILNAVKELNYIPNVNAKRLKETTTNTIGIFFNELFGPIYSEIAKGIEEVVHKEGYDLIACSTYGGDNSTAHKYLQSGYVDAAIVLGSHLKDEFLERIAKNNIPIVVLDRELSVKNIQSILIDNFSGAYNATKHLLIDNEDEIYYFTGPKDSYDNQKRFQGYKMALETMNIPLKEEYIVSGNFTEKSGYENFIKLYKKGIIPKKIFSANDEMAIGVITAMKEKNIKGVKLIGFDDIKLSNLISPKLSTISHKKYEMGVLASNVLFKMLAKKHKTPAIPIILSTELVERETT